MFYGRPPACCLPFGVMLNNIDVSSHFLGCDSTLASVWPLAAPLSLLFAVHNDNGTSSYELSDHAIT